MNDKMIGFERFEEDFYANPDTMLIKPKTENNESSLADIPLEYRKSPEEEFEDQRKVSLAEAYLNRMGIRVRTDMYGYYRNTYAILKDLGEYLSKTDK